MKAILFCRMADDCSPCQSSCMSVAFDAVERRLHAAAISLHLCAHQERSSGLSRCEEAGDFGDRHRAVADGLQELVEIGTGGTSSGGWPGR